MRGAVRIVIFLVALVELTCAWTGAAYATQGRASKVVQMSTKVIFQPSGKDVEIEGMRSSSSVRATTFSLLPGDDLLTCAGGAKLSLAAYRAGVAVAYNCKSGHCGTCEVSTALLPARNPSMERHPP